MGPPPTFNMGESLRSLTSEERQWLRPEVARLLEIGGLQRARTSARHVSRAFLVPKPAGGFRLVFDLRYLNSFCRTMRLGVETLKRLRLLAR